MTKAFGEAFGRANFTQQLKKKGIDVDKMHADNVKDAAAAKKRAAAASKDDKVTGRSKVKPTLETIKKMVKK